jgi:ubiquitin
MSEKNCDVEECDLESYQTVSAELATKVFTFETKATKVHLCREHYKKYKKETKKEREARRADWV